MRFARKGAGKRGGYRVVYFYSPADNTPIFLITVFAKNEKADPDTTGSRCNQAIGQTAFRNLWEKTMSKAFESIEKGLREALAHAQDAGLGTVHEVEIPEPDVRAIRKKTGLSQAAFARSIGVSKATLVNWEQGRRRPQGPARVLLALIARNPHVVQETLAEG